MRAASLTPPGCWSGPGGQDLEDGAGPGCVISGMCWGKVHLMLKQSLGELSWLGWVPILMEKPLESGHMSLPHSCWKGKASPGASSCWLPTLLVPSPPPEATSGPGSTSPSLGLPEAAFLLAPCSRLSVCPGSSPSGPCTCPDGSNTFWGAYWGPQDPLILLLPLFSQTGLCLFDLCRESPHDP